VLLALFEKPIKTRAPSLLGTSATKGLQAAVDLDSWNDSVFLEELNEWLSFGGILVESFFKKNRS